MLNDEMSKPLGFSIRILVISVQIRIEIFVLLINSLMTFPPHHVHSSRIILESIRGRSFSQPLQSFDISLPCSKKSLMIIIRRTDLEPMQTKHFTTYGTKIIYLEGKAGFGFWMQHCLEKTPGRRKSCTKALIEVDFCLVSCGGWINPSKSLRLGLFLLTKTWICFFGCAHEASNFY